MKTNYIHPSPGLYFGCGRSMPLDSRPVITVLALAAIAASTLGLLAYFRVLQGLSTATQWGLIGGGSGAAVTAIALGTGHLAHLKQARKEALQNITKQDLSALLMEISQQKDPVKALEQLADDIPYDKLKEIFDETFPQAGDVQARTQEAIERARLFLEVSRTSSPSAHSRLLKAWDIFIETIDSFFIAFGIAEFFDPPESKFDSGFKFQKIIMIVSLFTLLTSTLLPMLGAANGTAIVGGSLIGISILSILWPKIRPLPTRLPTAENWSQKAREGKLGATSGGRQDKLDELAARLADTSAHPLVVGPSGVGKTELLKSFVQAIEDGKYPHLKGKVVFYFNAADLAAHVEPFGSGNKILERIAQEVRERDRGNCILILDEVHELFRQETALGEQFKTFADKFHLVIGMTTELEYMRDIHLKNPAVDRRFNNKLFLSNTDETGTVATLSRYLLKEAPHVLIDKIDTLHYIYQQTSKHQQPLSALKILVKCLIKLSDTPVESESSKRAQEIRNILDGRMAGGILAGSDLLTHEQDDQIAPLKTELAEKEKAILEEHSLHRRMQEAKKQLAHIRKLKLELLGRINFPADTEPTCSPHELAIFMLFSSFEKQLEEDIKQLSQAGRIPITLTKQLVDQVLEEERVNEARRAEIAAQITSKQASTGKPLPRQRVVRMTKRGNGLKRLFQRK